MRVACSGQLTFLVTVFLSDYCTSSPYYFKFGDKAYPLHYSPSPGLNVSGGDLEEPESTTETSAFEEEPAKRTVLPKEGLSSPKQVPDSHESTPTTKLIQETRPFSKESVLAEKAKAFRPTVLVNMREGEPLPGDDSATQDDRSFVLKDVMSEQLPPTPDTQTQEAIPEIFQSVTDREPPTTIKDKAFRPSVLMNMQEGEPLPEDVAPTPKESDVRSAYESEPIQETVAIVEESTTPPTTFEDQAFRPSVSMNMQEGDPLVEDSAPTQRESDVRPAYESEPKQETVTTGGESINQADSSAFAPNDSDVRPAYETEPLQETVAVGGESTGQDDSSAATPEETNVRPIVESEPVQEESVAVVGESADQGDSAVPSFLTKGWQRGRAFGSSIKSQMKEIKKPNLNLKFPQQETIKEGSSKVFSAIAPAVLAVGELFYRPDQVPITMPAVIALTLLGSSIGFYLFLYFITVGYACGIALPVLVATLAYNRHEGIDIPRLTNVYAGLIVAWGVRAATFFLYREFFNWPELHEKVVEVNRAARLNAKFFCWVVFSGFYVCMITPCLLRLKTQKKWGVVGISAIVLQLTSLLVETVADFQKSAFKAIPGNRNRWCNVGIWKLSTNPNYLGEIMFWVGTFLGGVSCFSSPIHWIASIIGLLFIVIVIRGAISSLEAKHLRKYGNDVEFLEFRRTHSVLGPFHFSPQPQQTVSL